MHRKFSAIAKVKKQLLDAKEAALMEARMNISRIEGEILLVEEDQRSQHVPKQGTFCDLLHVKALGERLYRQKQELCEALEAAHSQADICLSHYQAARGDFEKIKYLEEQATSVMLKRLKKHEQLTLDEVALQLYALGGKVR